MEFKYHQMKHDYGHYEKHGKLLQGFCERCNSLGGVYGDYCIICWDELEEEQEQQTKTNKK